jgi:hypothetical protein
MKQAPDFFIIGTQKAGTTSLFHYLKQHPEILMPKHKESHYYDLHYDNISFEKYMKYYPKRAKGILSGEATPRYLYHPLVARRVYNDFPNSKLIVLLRNPIDRAYSQYNMSKKNRNISASFESIIRDEEHFSLNNSWQQAVIDEKKLGVNRYVYLSRGYYFEQLKVWLKYFPLKQFLILFSEDLYANKLKELNKVALFLGIDSFDNGLKDLNMRKGEYADMKLRTRKWLYDFYKPLNKKLFEQLKLKEKWLD